MGVMGVLWYFNCRSNVTKSIFNRLSSFKPFNNTLVSSIISKWNFDIISTFFWISFRFIPLRFQLFSLKTSAHSDTPTSYDIVTKSFFNRLPSFKPSNKSTHKLNFDSVYTFFRITVLVSNRHHFQLLIIILVTIATPVNKHRKAQSLQSSLRYGHPEAQSFWPWYI